MKAAFLLLLAALCTSPSAAVSSGMSPVSRVVELLNGLSKKIEEEGEQEENLYETYVCWAKKVIETKSASNEKAQSSVDSLEAYIADLDAGRVELTSERKDLEKELAGLLQDIETSNALRQQENEDFEAAKAEMTQAVTALGDALDVLKTATEGKSEGSLLTLRSKINEGFQARVADADALSHALEIGRQSLSSGDARFLQRLLTGDVPENKDWKKLNRKATFKEGYKKRSGKIQRVLAQLLAQFKNNLKDAEDKEEEAVKTHETLIGAKEEQKTAAEEALNKEEVEGGARGMSKEASQQEVDDLKTQIENDKKYIGETKTALDDKKAEWKDRKSLRSGELQAISQAISILHSDDARDNFKRSFKSQGYSLVQVGGVESVTVAARAAAQRHSAAEAIRSAGEAAGDQRLVMLAARLALVSGGHFDKVIEAIDKMISKLNDDEAEDLKNKEQCEKDRMEDTRSAIEASREIDELSDTISRLEDEIKEIEKSIEEKEEEIKDIEEQVKEATRNRESENTEWTVSEKEDKAAVETVGDAMGVLETFYQENGLNLFQSHAVPGQAGEAPVPPPATWEAPYGGKQAASTGIIGILKLIKEDIEKDISKAKTAEDDAQTKFDTFKKDSEDQIQELNDGIDTLSNSKTEKEGDIKTAKEERATQKEGVDVALKKIKDAEPGCNYFTINFNLRSSNRQIEIDGLDKAKAILKGAKFDEAPDPNREIKPGDALLLKRVRKAL